MPEKTADTHTCMNKASLNTPRVRFQNLLKSNFGSTSNSSFHFKWKLLWFPARLSPCRIPQGMAEGGRIWSTKIWNIRRNKTQNFGYQLSIFINFNLQLVWCSVSRSFLARLRKLLRKKSFFWNVVLQQMKFLQGPSMLWLIIRSVTSCQPLKSTENISVSLITDFARFDRSTRLEEEISIDLGPEGMICYCLRGEGVAHRCTIFLCYLGCEMMINTEIQIWITKIIMLDF